MRKAYSAPQLELEIYNLSASIASNCKVVVNNGPAIVGYQNTACSNYEDPFPSTSSYSLRPSNVSFYDDVVCDCYTTQSGYGYWTS